MKKITFLLLTFLFSLYGFSQGFPQNFDEITPYPSGLPTNWMRADNGVGMAQSWRLVNAAATTVNGTQSMFIGTEEIGQNNTSRDFLITHLVTVPENGQLRFQAHQAISGNQGTIYEVRYSTDVANQGDISQYQLLEDWTEPEMNVVFDSFEEKIVNLTPTLTAGQQVYIAFVRVHTQTTIGMGGDRWIIDDVNVTEKCFSPSGLDVPTIASESALLSWLHQGTAINFQYAVVPATASQPGDDSPLVMDTSSSATSFTATGLIPGMDYKYYVRAECDDDVFSDWAGPFFFSTYAFGTVCTDPITVTSLPYETDANTGDFLNLITASQGTGCGALPTGTNYLAGNDVIYKFVAPTAGLISIKLTPGAARTSVFVYNECSDISVSCLAGVANTNSDVRLIDDFPVVAGEDYYIVVSSASQTPTFAYNLIIQYENCEMPTGLGFDQANATLDGGNASWTEVETATTWQVAVQDAGQPIPNGPGTYIEFIDNDGVAGMPLTGLQTAHLYQYWVRSECSPGVYSAWAGPFVFNTAICAPEDQCTYTFRMTDSANNGWNGARMQIRQNGIVLPVVPASTPVNTIGGTFTGGGGPVDITVTMCDNVPFDVFWLTAGSQPQQCILSIINSFGQTIFTKPAGTGTPGSVVYNGIVECDTPRCDIAPTAVNTTFVTTIGATVNWTAPGTENVGYEIYYVLSGQPAPDALSTPMASGVNGSSTPFSHTIPNGLLADTLYDVYVRVVCNTPNNSPWSAVHTFITLPTCPKPINQSVTETSITLNSAELKWEEGGVATEWEVLLLKAGPQAQAPAAPGVVPVVTSGDRYYPGLTGALSLTPTDLDPATIYYYYVRAVCGGNDPSTWTGPIVFNTVTCADTDKCLYRFKLTTATGNSWNNARMEVRQNGIVVKTLGASLINNANGVEVLLCTDVPIDLYWSVAGSNPQNIGVSIQSPFTDIIYTKLPGEGTPLTVLYSDDILGHCTPPTCPKPTNLLVENITQTTAQLSWTAGGSEQQWEVYAVPSVGAIPPVNYTPLNTGVPGYYLTDVNENPYIIEDLTPGTAYIYYVRAICSPTDISTWTILNPKSFITKPVNDECSAATQVPVNPTRVCADSVTGNTLGGTLSTQGTTCSGGKDDDIWYSFVATSNIHIITFSNIVGTSTDINHVLYEGTDCDNLVQLYCSDPNVSIANNLTINTTYKIRVFSKETSTATNPRNSSFTLCITTPAPVTNDECSTAIVATVNDGLVCNTVTPGAITGATASPQSSSCAGAEDDDVWFKFVATSPKHIIDLKNVVGSLSDDLNHSLYGGVDCNSLVLEYCSADNQSIADGLTVGNTYIIRVWSAASTLQDITFDLCIGTILPPITVSTSLYTKEQLVTDILIKSECATVTNITYSTGTTATTNGIGYFNKDQSDFPFEDGIVLTCGSAMAAPGPNNSVLSNGGLGGDADLSAILAAQDPPITGTLANATSLEFDFVALQDFINFDFIFASEEYGTYQCDYSDAFAFILTDVTAGTAPINLAVIPGTTIPVSVLNIRDGQYNSQCESQNVEHFENYYANEAGEIGANINFNGVTRPLTATTLGIYTMIPGNTYHIKMVIADYGPFGEDTSLDSAVFLKGGSFDIGNIELPEDFLVSEGTAICEGDVVTLDSGLNPTLYNIEWFLNDSTEPIPGETQPVLLVTQQGTYKIQSTFIGTDCVTEDSVIVEYFIDENAVTPNDLVLCDASGNGIFNLEATRVQILSPFAPATHEAIYFLTIEDAENNVLENAIPVEDLEEFPGTNGQTIYVRVNYLGTSCFQVVDFDLIVQDLTPQFTLLGSKEICPEGTTTITVSPTNNNFDPALVSYTWTFGTDTLAETSGSLTINGEAGYGTYTVTVNNSGCIATQTFEITNANTTWIFDLTAPADLCPDETGTLSVNVTNNPNGLPVTYTFTLVDGSEVVSTTNSTTIDAPGTYSVMVDIQGCISGPETITVGESVANWQIAFDGEPYVICPGQNVTLSFTPTNFDINNPDATYTWTTPSGVEGQGATFTANEVGTYTLEVDILGCISSFQTDVDENTTSIQVEFEQGCDSNNYKLVAIPSNGSFDPLTSTYVWSASNNAVFENTAEGNTIILKSPGTFTVTVTTADGCSVSEPITVANTSCKIQKGISPDGNDKNDSFDLTGYNVREISIFNR
ncbi:choice-of-anchor L domain-containing protein, partial [Flavobacterium sp. PLA-1-15]|uniref:choice-of-anchor L domain-containing protein n=1 Tax=Flavobacterium sp. PLA-1-15 TaxID=3380533 RepID=UPI003B78A4B4